MWYVYEKSKTNNNTKLFNNIKFIKELCIALFYQQRHLTEELTH